MDRLSNLEFVQCVSGIKSGSKIPVGLLPDDQANLKLASKFLLYRNKSPMEIFGTFQQHTELGVIMQALYKLRRIEKQIIYIYLASGYPIDVVAAMTYRTEHHSINSLRSGLTNIRMIMEKKGLVGKK